MKTIRLFVAAALIATTTAASASNKMTRDGREPNNVLFMIDSGTAEDETQIYQFDSPEQMKYHLREKMRNDRAVKEIAKDQINSRHNTGFQGTEPPMLIFTQKSNKFSFGVGGFINLRTNYDINSAVQNIDFVPADIPMRGSYATKQQINMDASTSRIYFSGVANSRAIGPIHIFVDMDFRGGTGYDDATGVTNTYTPRLRCAYASFLGFTIGRDVTTFCDLAAAPQTVDFQGPNAYSFNYATVLRYSHSLCNDRLGLAIALEQPNVSGTYGTTFAAEPQRVPDIPMYAEYKMGAHRQHHFRVSAVLRDMYLHNNVNNENITIFGWGVKASGNIQPWEWVDLCFNGTYGKGITPYIQDLNGLGLDFVPNATNSQEFACPMFAWQAALTFNFTKRISATGGYSTAQVDKDKAYYSDCEYHKGQYAFGNIFYKVTPRLQVAGEYLYGSRRNMNCVSNDANRVSLMAQYNF